MSKSYISIFILLIGLLVYFLFQNLTLQNTKLSVKEGKSTSQTKEELVGGEHTNKKLESNKAQAKDTIVQKDLHVEDEDVQPLEESDDTREGVPDSVLANEEEIHQLSEYAEALEEVELKQEELQINQELDNYKNLPESEISGETL